MIEGPPAWLNLDEIAPPALRSRLNHAAAAFEALLPEIDRLAQRAYAAHRDYEAALEATGANYRDEIDPHTGHLRLRNVCKRIADIANITVGEKPNYTMAPGWWVPYGK